MTSHPRHPEQGYQTRVDLAQAGGPATSSRKRLRGSQPPSIEQPVAEKERGSPSLWRTPTPRRLLLATGTLAALIGAVPGLAVLGHDITPLDEASALLATELNTIEVIERFGPSVVAVTVSVRGRTMLPVEGAPGNEVPGNEVPDESQRFFGDQEPVLRSSGSGFLIESEGEPYLVTNFHVVEGALEPQTVDFRDGAKVDVTFPADADEPIHVEVVGVNPSFDLALLRLQDPAQLPPAEPFTIADSDGLRVGQKTVAVGNPFGLASSVTSGIVSALGRFVPTIGQLPVPMIQTDAAINPGNSGGPLLDSRGELIGINTALINPQGRSFAGLGFAVPSSLLVESLANLELGGVTSVSDTRPRLGIVARTIELIPPLLREELGLPERGVAVIEVQAGSVADTAGLQGTRKTITLGDGFEIPSPGDVIVAVDGEAIESAEDLAATVTYGSMAGDELDLTILRDGMEISVSLTLEISASNAVETPAG
jgi:serine protease Do